MTLQVKDKVMILNYSKVPVAEGTIVNVNEYREPKMRYCVAVEGQDDVMFFGEEHLQKKSARPGGP